MTTTHDKWLNMRLGQFSASQIHRLLTTERGGHGFGQTAITYIKEIVAEMLTGERKPSVSSRSIEWGNDHEAMAMDFYIAKIAETRHATSVQYFGGENPVFFAIPGIPAGGSPDGLIKRKKVIEIKCPYDTVNHIENSIMTLDEFQKSRKEYYAQLQLNMIATQTEKADFCSFDPRIIDDRGKLAILEVPLNYSFCNNMMHRIQEAADIRDTIYRTFKTLRREAA